TPLSAPTNGMAVWHYAQGRNPVVQHEGAPELGAGLSALWNGMTPVLRWNDGTATATRLNAMAVTADGREPLFGWISPSGTWADFHYTGMEDGSFTAPFNTLVEGAAAASHGGTIKIKSGSTSESLSLVKRLDLEAVGGPVTIGR